MKTIVIKNQQELDNLPESFNERTAIEIRSSKTIEIRRAYDNSTVRAYDNSTVTAYSNSTVRAYNNSTVEAYDNSTVRAYGNSTVTAYNNSTVEAYNNSTVRAYNNSIVRACDNSTVRAYNNSTVRAYNNSTVRACDNSTVEAYNNSTVRAYNNSIVRAYLASTIYLQSKYAKILKALDNCHIFHKTADCNSPEELGPNATVTKYEDIITPSFENWISRGIVYADGIYKDLVSQKTVGNSTIFEVKEFGNKPNSFVAKIGNKFAHGETIEAAIKDLRFKISDRDTTKYSSWELDTIKSTDDMIEAYMTITGACSMGTKQFCDTLQLKDEYSVAQIIDLTKDKYGNKDFEAFFKNRSN
jgi:hypothetical protein